MTLGVAHAQTAKPPAAGSAKKTPTRKELDAARKHFQAAEAAKTRSEYQTAALEYLAAYKLFEEPEFLFDVAEVYRLAGDEANALTYYQEYLELDAEGRGAAAARTAEGEIRRSIAAKDEAAKRAADEEAKQKADEEKAHAAATQPAPIVEAAAPEASPGRGLRIAGLVTGGAGVVAIGVGVVFGLRASSISSEASDWTTFDPKRYDEGKAAERNMFIFTGAGAAALVTGGVLYFLGHRAAASAEKLTLVPSIGPSQVTLSAAGRF
jgi:serine/threonine-protein kinase